MTLHHPPRSGSSLSNSDPSRHSMAYPFWTTIPARKPWYFGFRTARFENVSLPTTMEAGEFPNLMRYASRSQGFSFWYLQMERNVMASTVLASGQKYMRTRATESLTSPLSVSQTMMLSSSLGFGTTAFSSLIPPPLPVCSPPPRSSRAAIHRNLPSLSTPSRLGEETASCGGPARWPPPHPPNTRIPPSHCTHFLCPGFQSLDGKHMHANDLPLLAIPGQGITDRRI